MKLGSDGLLLAPSLTQGNAAGCECLGSCILTSIALYVIVQLLGACFAPKHSSLVQLQRALEKKRKQQSKFCFDYFHILFVDYYMQYIITIYTVY